MRTLPMEVIRRLPDDFPETYLTRIARGEPIPSCSDAETAWNKAVVEAMKAASTDGRSPWEQFLLMDRLYEAVITQKTRYFQAEVLEAWELRNQAAAALGRSGAHIPGPMRPYIYGCVARETAAFLPAQHGFSIRRQAGEGIWRPWHWETRLDAGYALLGVYSARRIRFRVEQHPTRPEFFRLFACGPDPARATAWEIRTEPILREVSFAVRVREEEVFSPHRQGDLLFVSLAYPPEPERAQAIGPWRGHRNHTPWDSETIEDLGVLEMYGSDPLIRVKAEASIHHPEHPPLILRPGVYAVSRAAGVDPRRRDRRGD